MKNLKNMNAEQLKESMEGPLSGLFKQLISGKYTYLTYFLCSSACFFFWMTPNHHKIRLIRPKRASNSRREGSKSGKYII